MADDYIPTTDEILDGYVTMRSREIPGDRVLASVQALSEAERWLAEHDAAKRAEWEAKQGETEWEYGSEGVEGTSDPDPRPLTEDKPFWPDDLEEVREPNAEQAAQIVAKWNEGDPGSCLVIRRRKAGPWMPAEDPLNVPDQR